MTGSMWRRLLELAQILACEINWGAVRVLAAIALIAFTAFMLTGCELPIIIHYITCGDEPCHTEEPHHG